MKYIDNAIIGLSYCDYSVLTTLKMLGASYNLNFAPKTILQSNHFSKHT